MMDGQRVRRKAPPARPVATSSSCRFERERVGKPPFGSHTVNFAGTKYEFEDRDIGSVYYALLRRKE